MVVIIFEMVGIMLQKFLLDGLMHLEIVGGCGFVKLLFYVEIFHDESFKRFL